MQYTYFSKVQNPPNLIASRPFYGAHQCVLDDEPFLSFAAREGKPQI
jgi:hypothetical protein